MQIIFPDGVRRIISRLSDEGYDSYAVGGCVRDSILGREPHDWDITTAAEPREVIRIFSDEDVHVIGTAGIRHGTVMVKGDDGVYEITTFRSDGTYTDHRRPENVIFSNTVEDDLARRDFTMNAIAAKPCGDSAIIVDPYGGMGDIKDGIIRTVGDPTVRFTEDALRILRAVRFSVQLGFTVESETVKAASVLGDTLDFVSAERITSELWQILCAPSLYYSAVAFRDVFDRIVPGGVQERFVRFCDHTSDPYVRLSLMLEHGSNGDVFFRKMRFTRSVYSIAVKLLSLESVPRDCEEVCRYMRSFKDSIDTFTDYVHIIVLNKDLPCEALDYDCMMREIVRIQENGVPYELSMLDIRGDDIIAAGACPEQVGKYLEYLLKQVQNGIIPNKKEYLVANIPMKTE